MCKKHNHAFTGSTSGRQWTLPGRYERCSVLNCLIIKWNADAALYTSACRTLALLSSGCTVQQPCASDHVRITHDNNLPASFKLEIALSAHMCVYTALYSKRSRRLLGAAVGYNCLSHRRLHACQNAMQHVHALAKGTFLALHLCSGSGA